jgi:hypothetical protein
MISNDDVVPKGVCNLPLDNVPDSAYLHIGRAQAGTFPDDACFKMDPDFPKNVKLADVLSNLDRLLVVSERLKDLLSAADALKQNEVYEVGVFNHKGRREKAKYFLIHQINFPPCADRSQTLGEEEPLAPDQYAILTKLVLDDAKIDPALAIFRAAEYPARPFFRRDIVAKIKAANVTGIEFFELNGFTKF